MKISKAISLRAEELLNEKKMTKYRLAKVSTLSLETLNSLFYNKTKDIQLKTLILICQGLDVSLSEFFSSDLFSFNDLDI